MVKLKWFGHACFLVVGAGGTRLVMDPYNAEVGYRLPLDEADYVTVSHEHFDHNSVENVPGRPAVLRGPGAHRAGEVTVTGVATWHDEVGGGRRGHNTVFCLGLPDGERGGAGGGGGGGVSGAGGGEGRVSGTGAGVTLCHLGDLGHQLSAEQLAAIGPVDLLLVPVGGTYTLGPADAARQVRAMRPRIVVPMHHKTAALAFPLRPVEDFVAEMVGSSVERPGASAVTRTGDQIRSYPRSERPHLLLLDYVR